MNKDEIKAKAKNLQVLVRIGKSGLTENTIKEIDKLLKKRKLIKVKILQAALESQDKKQLASEISKKTNSQLVDMTGFVLSLYRK